MLMCCCECRWQVAKSHGHNRSLFDRLIRNGHSFDFFEEQYRMHPKISSWPNLSFYHNRLCDEENVKQPGHGPLQTNSLLKSPYLFVDIGGEWEEEIRVPEGAVISGRGVEVAVVQSIIKCMAQGGSV